MVPYGTYMAFAFSALEAFIPSTCIGIIRKVPTGQVILPIRRIPPHAQVLWTLQEEGQITKSK